MYDKTKEIDWEEIFNLYNTIKWLYALCEETDEELNTNLQPLNEFRAALDHLMRIVAIENIAEYKDNDVLGEVSKLKGHLRRALYDICDMLAINYRNKIVDILQIYDVEEIQSALPSYYSEIRPRLEKISEQVALLRTEKRFSSEKEEEAAEDEYPKIVKELLGYYESVNLAVPSLLEIRNKKKKEKHQNIAVQWIIPIASVIVGSVIGVLGWFM